jgi:hypothetical protein
MCLTNLERLAFNGNGPAAGGKPCQLQMSLLAKLTSLRSLRLPEFTDYPSLSHLSALR